MSTLTINKELLGIGNINQYTEEGARRKKALHAKGKTFLKALAAQLGLGTGDYDLRSNLGGVAVAGEVTLHADNLYLQLSDTTFGPGEVRLMYRSCDHRKDCTGHSNHFVELRRLNDSPEETNQLIVALKRLMSAVPA